jgi:phage-related protein
MGPAIIPEIVNETNGMRMRVHREIGPGEMLAIDSGAETVQLYSNSAWSDASGYIDFLRSDYVLLDPGPNSLAYFNLDDSVNTRVEVSWGDWYLGVG